MYKFLIQGRAELLLLDICIPLRSRFTVRVFWKLVPSVYGESDPESLALASAGWLHQLFCSSLWLNLVKLPFFTLAEWFLPWLQHSLLPNGLYLSSYFTERQMREPIDPATLSCYRLDHFGQNAMVPNLLCRYRAKPTRLPCTTTSSPTEQGKEHTAAPTDPTASADKNGSQSYRHQYAIFTSVLDPEFQILQEYYNLG